MLQDILDLGRAQYDHAMGMDEVERDEDGFLILRPSAARVDQRMSDLTTNISSLEEKLKKYRDEQAKAKAYTKSDEYRQSKKRLSKKKKKKQRTTLLEMVFNNADARENETDEDLDSDEDGEYRESRKSRARNKKPANTLSSTYGQRFSPVVSMLYDTIDKFDTIASDLEDELSRNNSKSMYRTAQIGNLISATNSKLSAVKELASVAKTVSDLEYKKEKDKKAEQEGDNTKLVSSFASKYLRGNFDDTETKRRKKKGKQGKNSVDDDDDEPDDEIKKQRNENQRQLASELAKRLGARKDEIHLSDHERFIGMEGKYNIVVVADSMDPDNDWKFIAVDPKTGKELKDFRDKYKGLLPKRKNCRMTFDLARLKAYDKNSARTYKLILKN